MLVISPVAERQAASQEELGSMLLVTASKEQKPFVILSIPLKVQLSGVLTFSSALRFQIYSCLFCGLLQDSTSNAPMHTNKTLRNSKLKSKLVKR
jgi:hypothetical protein